MLKAGDRVICVDGGGALIERKPYTIKDAYEKDGIKFVVISGSCLPYLATRFKRA